MNITTTPRIGARQAREHMSMEPGALLVCAYDREEKCRDNYLEGAISLAGFRSRAVSLPKDREIIFYCA
jgi:hypothetical protein